MFGLLMSAVDIASNARKKEKEVSHGMVKETEVGFANVFLFLMKFI